MKPRSEDGIIICPRCGHTERNRIPVHEQDILQSRQSGPGSISKSSFKVMDSDTPNAMPTTTAQCAKCGNMTAYWWMLQTRSADEATTQFFRCTECNYTWRNYS
jgi:DNA-directed RNA polymerase subunit M